ncbi:hypothetical protein QYF61_017083 [Mycteria americana]|uniref:Uncharacterized protein n=1 Tax=Mycteria americana TaxID=33587 RepID=A0AAN7MDA8_MYCAM|nr:hypothetical protein QYF61_017083 [Mycteria americana]
MYEERLWKMSLFGEKKTRQGEEDLVTLYLRGGYREGRDRGAQRKAKMQWTPVGAREILLRYKENLFVQRLVKHGEEAQRDDGLSFLGDNSHSTWTDKAKRRGMACVKHSISKNCVAASKGPVGKVAGQVRPAEKHGLFIQLEPCTEAPTGLPIYSGACSDGTRGNGFKLKEGRFRVDTRKKFFTMRVVRHWPRLPREVGDAPSLETFEDLPPQKVLHQTASVLRTLPDHTGNVGAGTVQPVLEQSYHRIAAVQCHRQQTVPGSKFSPNKAVTSKLDHDVTCPLKSACANTYMTYSLEKGSSWLTSDMVQAVDVGLGELVQLVEGPGALPGKVLVCAETTPGSASSFKKQYTTCVHFSTEV